ncbi:isocitrate lyase/PEP mutase family protein [Paraburkholderia sp.]|uniref:isocitrate lyase/PEP mutase family protein n=1 Tax=Paraburkholderia sp. TaxID=1926495 RepID=UPI0039E2E3D6
MNQLADAGPCTVLRHLIEGDMPQPMAGTYDALTAMLAERAGFPIVYVSGYGISAAKLGMPDVGLLTQTEMIDTLNRVCDAVRVPVVADGDTCYGNYVNARRLMREIEKAGAAGVHIEDQTFPKRCGHMEGKSLVPASEMANKIKAMIDTRADDDFVLIARTDAIAVEGFEAAIERSERYREAGADVIFIEAPVDDYQMREIPRRIAAPTFYNASWDGLSPLPSLTEIGELGYRIVSYPDIVMCTAAASAHMYRSILDTGFYPEGGRMHPFRAFNQLLGLDEIDALIARYGAHGAQPVRNNLRERPGRG